MAASPAGPRPLLSRRSGALAGTVTVPGDKSISHRALMFGALSLGETRIEGLLEGDDVLRTAAALRALGAEAERLPDGTWITRGRGVGGLAEPAQVLDMGNSGTAARLLMGLLATHPFTSVMTGDASLTKRPMARVTTPLETMGARFALRSGGRLPGAVIGTDRPVPIAYRLPVASAQVKSAILLAGLNAPGRTTVIEPEPTRDHTERMLRHFGIEVTVEEAGDGALAATVTGQGELTARDLRVPADPSSAAFPAVAALIRPGSALSLPGVGTNPRRTGLFETLRAMGADIAYANPREEGGEPVADLLVRASGLRGVEVPPERAPSMIDEYPVLCIAAACAEGPTVMRGIGELRVKESDRLAMMADGLAACGVTVEAGEDWMVVHGRGRPPAGGATVATAMDHRIAMSFLVLGMATEQPVRVDDGAFIDTSFPGFVALMNGLGADIAAA
ncbi:3-phosphoshikimate 1-carboxyvinyltransferase [Rhodospirillum centenum]|uniref:3-phosphoshikimate 1-carboxyvinyltransferase n=1 Tax=Rhodospirillum centenum (strain ATCC 51521 / SW) TaxID=414684 RepID=B6IUQ0_RHOCS|nr:3-phosphoshikimate 1-carboxyvinyltransferase [Rhodospirillum centenum]ACI99875.1 3-phosphoshikimate 1-carboxyvinyltransferase [Rhodospirillum centenum SW]